MLCILTIVRWRRGICSAGTIPTPPTLPLITLLLMPPSLTLHMLILSCAGGAERSPEGAEGGVIWASASVLVLLMLKEGGLDWSAVGFSLAVALGPCPPPQCSLREHWGARTQTRANAIHGACRHAPLSIGDGRL